MADERDDEGGVAAALPTDALKDAGQQLLGLAASATRAGGAKASAARISHRHHQLPG